MKKSKKVIILENYLINKSTKALVPASHPDYCTIVFEGENMFYVKKPCFAIIEGSCLPGGSSYIGRRTAAVHETDAKRKVPIAICTKEEIYAIPTKSPKSFNCTWLFYHHVQNFTVDESRHGKCIANMTDGIQISLDVSVAVMNKQLSRTARCIMLFSKPTK
ncbi:MULTISPECIES: competence protein ComK [Bacillaceae]|uniref:Competence protein ComK n=1 Tax=Evansella alkalicola TaxID=745819 RepID=A0ABS6JX42_9BACI|nr:MULTISPECIES: competence protein ComK [Bacillaceae]MBU9723161.1 competence protein ComK [Bacillus alkalicola]